MGELINGHYITGERGPDMVWCDTCEEVHDLDALRRGRLGVLPEEQAVVQDELVRRLNEVWRYVGYEVNPEARACHDWLFAESRQASSAAGGPFLGLLAMLQEGGLIMMTARELGIDGRTSRRLLTELFVAMKPHLDEEGQEIVDGMLDHLS